MSKLFAIGLGLIVLVGLSIAGAGAGAPTQDRPAEGSQPTFVPEPVRVLEPDTIAVRLLLGVKDEKAQPWNGQVKLDRGEVVGVDGWRFRQSGKITGRDTWEASSLLARNPETLKSIAAKPRKTLIAKGALLKKGAAAKTKKARDAETTLLGAFNTSSLTPTGVIVRLRAPEDASLSLETKQGRAEIKLADLISGQAKLYLDGQVEARRVPAYAPLAVGPLQEDFPAAVADGKGGAWVAIVAHEPRGGIDQAALRERPKDYKRFVPEGGGDRIDLIHYDPSSSANGQRIEVAGPGRDIWRPAVARDERGKIVVVWAEQKDHNWDLYTRTFDPETRSSTEEKRLTTDPGADADPVLAAVKGRVLVAWQAWRDGQADILLAPVDDSSKPINVSNNSANDWAPAVAAGPSGVFIAFDSYRNGNYDVFLASLAAGGDAGPTITPVANSSKFEGRPTIGVDAGGRVWVAYEERGDNWGKDFGKLPDPKGSSLYSTSTVKVRLVEGARVLETGDPAASLAVPRDRAFNSFPRLTLDASGRPWLLYRHREEWSVFGGAIFTSGAIWTEYATTLAGKTWTPPQPLPRSDNLLDNRPALVARPAGGILAAYSGDGRLHRELEMTRDLALRYYSSQGTPPGLINNDVFIAAVDTPKGSLPPEPLGPVVNAAAAPPVHPNEAGDVTRIRGHRVNAGGKTYQLLRGEFHRHTEISFDGASDGALEDMWRYALDAGRLDWIGCGDHDNGGTEYTWWITQKTTDLYHAPPRFLPLFTYERSVQYPGGHRNVMFPRRGVRTLPRLVDANGVRTDVAGHDEDAEMLYGYLHELGGICAAHTTATGMGTDWRANDPEVEPFVEIYQGIRDSYEHLGAPRVPRQPEGAAGGWAPLGQVWNALALQYRLGFQASSDHVSTHISFAIALAEQPTRSSIFEAFKKRHCYAATDNIVLDVRSGEHLMGDEFTAKGPVTLRIFAHGTAPIRKVDVIKDFVYVYSTTPGTNRVEFRWTDEAPESVGDLSWYYVRLIQEDGELAWGSPIWVHKARTDSAKKE